MKSSILAATILVLGFSGDVRAEPPSTNICIENFGCTEPSGAQKFLNEWELGKLGCEPLAVIRNRILYNAGMCIQNRYMRLFFNQECTPDPVSANKIYAEATPSMNRALSVLGRLERKKGCLSH